MGTKSAHFKDYVGWPLEPELEISLKKVSAIILHGLGFDVKLSSIKDIDQFPYVDSRVEASYTPRKLADPDISEQTISVGLNICQKLVLGKKSQSFEPAITDAEVTKFIPTGSQTHSAFHNYNIWDLQYSFLACSRNDYLDTALLRYIVARSLNADKSVQMALSCLNWRKNVHPVESYLWDGDAVPVLADPKSPLGATFRLNKIYIRGYDVFGRPLIVVKVAKHFRHDCSDADFERIICLLIEWARLGFRESHGVNKGSILFDMTGFSLANVDLHAVRFLTAAFEANYPEYLGAVLIHKAPWIFSTVWKIIKGWVDPLVATKIHFTNTYEQLTMFINDKHIPESLGGTDRYRPEYVEPTKENSLPKPVDTQYEEYLEEYFACLLSWVESTANWITAETRQESQDHLVQRLELQKRVARLYTELDPYIRARGVFDRCNEMTKIGL
ncbi:phosphatidylinositol transfer protein csr1 [Yamadazyma tenuis]|uniref:CRAL-TRIO domain-containing protein n=1 Tax=Candida tenuis (strain ATCC 10573 / BCRC 21748 / CBS 615 / JCM 9827 / NBRC 10315 / NRRL Y-1498 / VKM Y-70) TaxID=590646 RepID=G3B3X1_CANTC|nr:uncharacterized protein CANTEDRAFT_121681 [Yamadazyma tenuis ATCC 10573]EGV63881.1 hypothetical protein CANTEDRAFT_121681 [Yamadazyma tenuis ATCC 10573]WEJ96501.1 phosphatidylinositol transfer protein csr1 [Yamadazyma tenuis]